MHHPDLRNARQIAFDIETYDPNLKELGPGVYRKDGKILGVSICDGEGFAEYYNLGHYDCDASERAANVAYLREVLALPIPKLGQRIQYDIDWLENGEYGFKINGELRSIEIAEALIDETLEHYDLDSMAHRYLQEGKQKGEPEKFCESNGWKGDFRQWLWKMPYDVVRAYGIGDADQPVRIFAKQAVLLEQQDLMDLFKLECELIRCLVQMRRTGVMIDQDKRDRNGLMIQNRIEELQQDLFARYGEFNCNSTKQIAPIFDRERIPYPVNPETGNPNIDDHFWTKHAKKDAALPIPLAKQLFELRQNRSHLEKFVLGSHVKFVTPDGLIHAQFHNTRTETLGGLRGTRSGRFSSTTPNLQQQPAIGVDEYWGRICREDFVPFPDHWWMKIDYSQIEYRFMAHFAVGPGADDLRAAYNVNADQDYHQFIMDLTGLKRRYAKNLNFGVAFGMGARHMAELFGWELEYCYEVLNIYHSRAPYVRATVSEVERVARSRGFIKTFLKRRSHLVDPNKAYTMYCRLMQGSAADLMKKAMHDCYKAGVFNILKLHATVHDELDCSVPKTKEGIEAAKEMHHIMETCLTLKVPIKAEIGIGRNWAEGENHLESWEKLEEEIK